MNLTSLTTADWQQISKLLAKKEGLLSQIADVDKALSQIEGGQSRPASAARKPARPAAAAPAAAPRGRRSAGNRRGAVKEKIIASLKGVGKEGLAVKDLAQKVGTKYGNISVWFQTTGKKVKEIKKVGPARYAWVG